MSDHKIHPTPKELAILKSTQIQYLITKLDLQYIPSQQAIKAAAIQTRTHSWINNLLNQNLISLLFFLWILAGAPSEPISPIASENGKSEWSDGGVPSPVHSNSKHICFAESKTGQNKLQTHIPMLYNLYYVKLMVVNTVWENSRFDTRLNDYLFALASGLRWENRRGPYSYLD